MMRRMTSCPEPQQKVDGTGTRPSKRGVCASVVSVFENPPRTTGAKVVPVEPSAAPR